MKIPERRVIVGVVLAFIVWYSVFMVDILLSFWYRVTLGSLILAAYAHQSSKIPKITSIREIGIGLGSGVLLYLLFYIGFNVFRPLVAGGAINVYIFRDEIHIIIPALLLPVTSFCEEYFWRNYVQMSFIHINGKAGIIITSMLYAAIHIPTLNLPLTAAALIAGLAWGLLYDYTDSFWLVVFSHITWTELIFVLLPLQ
jgi:membrane protease YdiL (CAAX protease family)